MMMFKTRGWCWNLVKVELKIKLKVPLFAQLSVQYDIDKFGRLEICQKIYTTEDFRVKNLHRNRVIFDIC